MSAVLAISPSRSVLGGGREGVYSTGVDQFLVDPHPARTAEDFEQDLDTFFFGDESGHGGFVAVEKSMQYADGLSDARFAVGHLEEALVGNGFELLDDFLEDLNRIDAMAHNVSDALAVVDGAH